MRKQDDRAYYSRRTDEEIARGDTAVDATIAAIHYELAWRYALLAAGGPGKTFELRLIEGSKLDSVEERSEAQLGTQRSEF